MQTGIVKFFNEHKGFGFIKPDEGSKDVFVHVTDLEASGLNRIVEGQRIRFNTAPDRKGKGPKAINIVVA